MELSIIIPCYNEEKRIIKTYEKIFNYISLKKINTELIFVNDGSVDGTLVILEDIKKKKDKKFFVKTKIISDSINRGKGYAVKSGILSAIGRYILICDADLSTPITELEKLLRYIDENELVIGSRKKSGAKIIKPQPSIRIYLGKSYSFLSKVILGVNVYDFTCGFKLLQRNAAKEIAKRISINGWAYDSEILKIAKIQNFVIKEIGIVWENDERSKVKIWRDIFSSGFGLLRIVINSYRKKYC